MRNKSLIWAPLLGLALAAGCGSAGDGGVDGGGDCYDSTFAAIQGNIFEGHDCTSSSCHGSATTPAGTTLLLTPDVAYGNMLRASAKSHGTLNVVEPNDEELSVLYLKLAARTNGISLSDLGVSGTGMPQSGAALSAEELATLRTWIRAGAPETGVVAGTEAFLGCNEPPLADPAKVVPPDPPAIGEGVQLYSGGWDLPRESEDEVCFITYYNFEDVVPENVRLPCPADAWGSDRDCFSYDELFLAQDAQSHHAIIQSFIPQRFAEDHERYDAAHPDGNFDPLHPDWPAWKCLGGANAGQDCDPTAANACGVGACATVPDTAIACATYRGGPPEIGALDARVLTQTTFGVRRNVATVQEFLFTEKQPQGVYAVLPVEGFMIWNSHAFNLTKKDTTVEQYMNLYFLEGSEREHERVEIFAAHDIFGMGTVMPFTEREVCTTFTIPRGGRVLSISSHMHQHGRLFRIWDPPNTPCTANGGNCTPPAADADYTNRIYDDPLYVRYAEPNLPAYDQANEADRTYKFCAVYDNGATEKPVKRNSNRPDANTCSFLDLIGAIGSMPPPGIPDDFVPPGVCGCAMDELACIGGDNQGQLCGGDDGVCGDGGECDACPLWGGVTTEDEMFIMLGSYYVEDI